MPRPNDILIYRPTETINDQQIFDQFTKTKPMINAAANYRAVAVIAPWVAAFGRLRLAALRPGIRRAATVGVLVLLSLSYVWQANASAAANVGIRSLQRQAAALEEEHSRLERQAVQLRSLERVAAATSGLGLVALPSQEFAGAAAGAVAVAR